ncbi:hypothetical protein BJD12_00985 [Xanthomonas vesicatoria ATCC 35937]|nr:hypothetical protein BJD12_00985 [Xanthomonas vesicatoria ATCC 35937]
MEEGSGEGTSRGGFRPPASVRAPARPGIVSSNSTDVLCESPSRHILAMATAATRRMVSMSWNRPKRMANLLVAELGCK